MMLSLTGVACQMAQTWWLRKLVDLDRDGILHPMQVRQSKQETRIKKTPACQTRCTTFHFDFNFIPQHNNKLLKTT